MEEEDDNDADDANAVLDANNSAIPPPKGGTIRPFDIQSML
jgi:hypothetical protein